MLIVSITMKKIIQKALEELSKEKPDISYVRGMLEVLAGEEEFEYIPPKIMNTPTQTIPTLIPPTFLPPTIAGAKRLIGDNTNEIS